MHLRGVAAAGRLMAINRPRPKVAIRGRQVSAGAAAAPDQQGIEADLRDSAAGAASCLTVLVRSTGIGMTGTSTCWVLGCWGTLA